MRRPASRRGKLFVFILLPAILAVAAVTIYLVGRGSGKGETPAAAEAAGKPAAGKPGVVAASNKSETKGEGAKKDPVPVSVAEVSLGDVSSYITSSANLVPENDVKVLAEAEGRVSELMVEEGDAVGRGQVLATLVKEDAEIALKKAQVKAANARQNFERAGRMLAENLISREQHDKIRTDNEVAIQEEAEAAWKLEKTTLRAPFAGRLTERLIRVGQHVRPGDPLFSVADFDPLVARIYLPEKDVLGLTEGRAVRITLKADDQTRFDGRIRQISPVVDPATGTVKVTVEAVRPPALVRPGAFVTLDIVRETRPRVPVLPREAVLRELEDSYVFVVDGTAARRRAVSLGLEEAGRIEVLSGLKTGERVIVAGQGGLKDGAPVKVMPAARASDLGPAAGRPPRKG